MHRVNNECRVGKKENKPRMDNTGSDVVEISPDRRYIRYNELLGRGAFKSVYKGFDEVAGREIAWNLVIFEDALQSPEHLERLYSEVHLLRTLKHENVLRSYASWVDDGNKTINMITELFTSGSLRQYRQKHKSVDIKAIKNWARQILRGLEYLHTQSPPVIHRDLKCDNIFVNGNHGEVKIGDLGLATIMQKPTARSVIGTPEFMAPELYEEEYNELVDIYSFGMCILELVTCEYPYSECKNQAQIYKKVTSGIKPVALGKIMDLEVRRFIEKCLVPASHRLSAAELLEEPFLFFDNHRDHIYDPPQLTDFTPKSVNSLSLKSNSIDSCSRMLSMSTCCESTTRASMSALEMHSSNDRYTFSLKGEKSNDQSIELTLRIADYSGLVRNIHFAFILDSDTAFSIAEEMVTALDLWKDNIIFIAELINSLISQFVPVWATPCGSLCMSERDCSYGKEESGISQRGSINSQITRSKNSESVRALSRNTTSVVSDATRKDLSFDDCGLKSGISYAGSWASASSVMSLNDDDLKVELDAINLHYQQRFQELVKMKEAAIENAKKKWIMKKKSVL